MPTYDTPEPISVSLELGVGDIRIAASDRTDTVVEVRPSDPTSEDDVTAAEQTRVEFADGRLSVKAPKSWRQYTWWGEQRVDRRRDRPADRLAPRRRGRRGRAALHRPLGELRYKTGVGAIRLDQTGPVQLRTGAGDVSVERAAGRAEITTGSGARRGRRRRRAGRRQELQRRHLDRRRRRRPPRERRQRQDRRRPPARDRRREDGQRRHPPRRGRARRGRRRDRRSARSTSASSTASPAWLELKTSFGNVRNDLDAADRPEPGEDAVEIRARTGYGDITIHRVRRHRARRERSHERDRNRHPDRRDGHGPAQGVRRRRRPRRHRPRDRGGNGLRAARARTAPARRRSCRSSRR